MMKKIIYTAILTVCATYGVQAQTPQATPTAQPSPSPSVVSAPADLNTVLREATKQVDFYEQTFRDLLATETKTFEDYNKNGDLRDTKIIESNFLVYQSAKDNKAAAELRNVTKVDGELVPESQARADNFLAELGKTSTTENELEKVRKESLRYDRSIFISGFTLSEGIVLSKNLLPVFDFKMVGTENIQGSEVYVISYQQTRKSPFITVNEKSKDTEGGSADFDIDIPGALKKSDKFMRGKLWIDKNTFQLWREERQLTVKTPTASVVAFETIFEYAPSEFGILVPKKITSTEYEIKKAGKNEDYQAVKNTMINFEYSKFRKTNVEVLISDDEN